MMDPSRPRLHWMDGWYFQRAADEAVLVQKNVDAREGAEVVVEAEIPPAEWASIVASVSKLGETAEVYAGAEALHAGELPLVWASRGLHPVRPPAAAERDPRHPGGPVGVSAADVLGYVEHLRDHIEGVTRHTPYPARSWTFEEWAQRRLEAPIEMVGQETPRRGGPSREILEVPGTPLADCLRELKVGRSPADRHFLDAVIADLEGHARQMVVEGGTEALRPPPDQGAAGELRFRKRPVVITAAQWFKNGDHPADYASDWDYSRGEPPVLVGREGLVVRYFRRPEPEYGGEVPCPECGVPFHAHGFIDTKEGGHRVCPGDWIIRGVKGELYTCKPDIFAATYDPVGYSPDARD